MKRIFVSVSVLFLLINILTAAGIHVDKPVAGQTIYKVNTTGYMIKWTVSGNITKNVKIRLLNKTGTTKIYDITNSTPIAPGQYLWTKNLINNTDIGDYVIRVKTIDDEYWDNSEVFSVMKKGNLVIKNPKISKVPVIRASDLKGVIKLTSPITNHSYEVNKPMSIAWEKNIGSYSKVNIFLCSETDNNGKIIFNNEPNSGMVQWTPPSSKVSWPGNRPFIKISTPDDFYSGKSGLFNIVPPAVTPPPTAHKKTIAITPVITNKKSEKHTNSGEPECLSMGMSLPGRYAKSKELKTGHWKIKSKGVKCGWAMHEYYFFSKLDFDISVAASKEIIRAELLITLSGEETKTPWGPGTAATNEYCNSQSRIFFGNKYLKSFSIFEEGKSVKINLLNSVKDWAALNQVLPYSITIKGRMDYVPITHSVCLRYYMSPILFVEYKE